MTNPLSQFRDAMLASGLNPPVDIEIEKMHRFPGISRRNSNTAGWCKLFDGMQRGVFGDWASGLSVTWRATNVHPISCTEYSELMQSINRSRAQAEKTKVLKQTTAAIRAASIWNTASFANNNHPYLIRKVIGAHGAKVFNKRKSCDNYNEVLILPVTDFTGSLTSLQFIEPNGQKRLLTSGRKRGCFIRVTIESKNTQRVIICEGWATGCTLAQNDPTAMVLAAIDAGNMKVVAIAARQRWPNTELVIAGDDDRQTQGNPGLTLATAAALASDALLILPDWPSGSPDRLTDFNDLAIWLKKEQS